MVGLALSCGSGTTTNDGVPTVTVSGTIDFSPNPQKPFFRLQSGSQLTGKATEIVTGESYEVNINGSDYEVAVTRVADLNIEIYRDGALILSRVLSQSETQNSKPSSAINLLTHVQAKMAVARYKVGLDASFEDAVKSINAQVFGNGDLTVAQLSLSRSASLDGPFSAVVATYGQLLRSSSSASVNEALDLMNSSMSYVSQSAVRGAYKTMINAAGPSVAAILASAHEGAKDQEYFSASAFTELAADFTSATIQAALLDAKFRPFFNNEIDTLRKAAPGVLFTYKFPAADTNDVLGIESYSGSWVSEPDGSYKTTYGENSKLEWIPSFNDIGATREFQLFAKGVNGRTSQAKSITITVNNLEIKATRRKKIGNVEVASGLVNDDDYMYLMTYSASDNQLSLNKFKIGDLEAAGSDTLLDSDSITIAQEFSPIGDLMLNDNLIYVAGGNSIAAYDSTWTGDITGTPLYINRVNPNGNLLNIARYGGNIFVSYSESNKLKVHQYNEKLSSKVDITEYFDPDDAEGEDYGAFGNDYSYIANSNTGKFFTPYLTNLPLPHSTFSTSKKAIFTVDRSMMKDPALYQSDGEHVYSHKFSSANLITTSKLTGVTIAGNGLITNGTYVYLTENNSKLRAKSLAGGDDNVEEQDEGSSYPLNYSHFYLRSRFGLRNVPEGIESGKSGAYIYTVGQIETQAITSTWYFKTYKAQPKD